MVLKKDFELASKTKENYLEKQAKLLYAIAMTFEKFDRSANDYVKLDEVAKVYSELFEVITKDELYRRLDLLKFGNYISVSEKFGQELIYLSSKCLNEMRSAGINI